MKLHWVALAAFLFFLPISSAQLTIRAVKPEIVTERIQGYRGNDSRREETLKGFFESAGCKGEQFSEQPVKGLKQANLICVLPGDTDSVILIGAHFDHVDAGDGVVDNWSGASLLPSLFEAQNIGHRRHTMMFVAFAGEERGLVGSRFYVKNLPQEHIKKIRAMVCIDTLGLGPARVWVSRSDKELVGAFAVLANAMKIPASRVDVDGVGYSDEESFIPKKIPVIVIHSITQGTLRILHTRDDNYRAVKFDDYYASYRLLSAYLTFLDQNLDQNAKTP
jgi:hypothetical protein